MCAKKNIHTYMQYDDLKPENGFNRKDKNETYIDPSILTERFSLSREIVKAGIKPYKNSIQQTKIDWNPSKSKAIRVQLHIPRYIDNNGQLQTEKYKFFNGQYSKEVINQMLNYYLDDYTTVASFNQLFFMQGKSAKVILDDMKKYAQNTQRWVERETKATSVYIFMLSFQQSTFIFLINPDNKRIFDILINASIKELIETLQKKAPNIKRVYMNFSQELLDAINDAYPPPQNLECFVDFAQIPLFVDDLISLKSSRECRDQLEKCKKAFEKILAYPSKQSYMTRKKNFFEQIDVLKSIAKTYASLTDISEPINNFFNYLEKHNSNWQDSYFVLASLYPPCCHIKNIIKIMLRGDIKGSRSKFTAERLHFHMYCQMERLIKKTAEPARDETTIKEIEKNKRGNCERKILPSRITTDLYKSLHTASLSLIYAPLHTDTDYSAINFVGKDGIEIWTFIDYVLGDIGYCTNPQEYFHYETQYLPTREIGCYLYIDRESLNKLWIDVDNSDIAERTLPFNSIDVVLEHKRPSGKWKFVDSWNKTDSSGIGCRIFESKLVPYDFWYRIKCTHCIGNSTIISTSDKVWVGFDYGNEMPNLIKSGFFKES